MACNQLLEYIEYEGGSGALPNNAAETIKKVQTHAKKVISKAASKMQAEDMVYDLLTGESLPRGGMSEKKFQKQLKVLTADELKQTSVSAAKTGKAKITLEKTSGKSSPSQLAKVPENQMGKITGGKGVVPQQLGPVEGNPTSYVDGLLDDAIPGQKPLVINQGATQTGIAEAGTPPLQPKPIIETPAVKIKPTPANYGTAEASVGKNLTPKQLMPKPSNFKDILKQVKLKLKPKVAFPSGLKSLKSMGFRGILNKAFGALSAYMTYKEIESYFPYKKYRNFVESLEDREHKYRLSLHHVKVYYEMKPKNRFIWERNWSDANKVIKKYESEPDYNTRGHLRFLATLDPREFRDVVGSDYDLLREYLTPPQIMDAYDLMADTYKTQSAYNASYADKHAGGNGISDFDARQVMENVPYSSGEIARIRKQIEGIISEKTARLRK